MDYNHNDLKLEPQAVAGNERDNLVAKKTAEDKAKAQKTELNAALMTAIKTPLTLVLAIAMTIIAVSSFAAAISSAGSLSFFVSVWIAIVALIDCIGIWKLWGFDKEITSKSLKSFKGYLSLQKALNVISMILIDLLAAVLLIISIALMVAFDKLSINISEIIYDVGSYLGYELLVDPDTVLSFLIIGPAIIVLIALALIIFTTICYSFINQALNKVIKYVKRLSNSIDGDANNIDDYKLDKKPPFISLIIFGGIYVIFAPFTLGIWNILCGLAIGVYFIFIALLFKNIHKQINASAIDKIDVPADNQAAAHIDNQVVAPTDKQVAAPADNQAAPIDKQVAVTADNQAAAPADNQVAAPADNQVAAPTDKQVAAPADNQAAPIDKKVAAPIDKKVAAPIDKKVAAPADKQVSVSADKQTDAPAVKKITVQIIKKPIRTKLSIRKSRLVGNAVHKFIAVCDLENLDKNKGKAELIRLVDEGKLSQKDVTYISVDWINKFRKSGVFKDMLEAKRAEEKRLAKILEKISQKNALVKLGLPECIKDVNLSDLFNEIHARKVLADLRKNHQRSRANKLDRKRRRYDLPKEILTPEAIEMICNSKLFEDIREAKRLYQEHMILIPKDVSGKKYYSLLIPDCIIEEWPNRLTVVDFKTDKQSKKRFVKMYTRQLSRYKNAIKHEFGKSPKSTEIYSFHLDETIKIRIPD